MLTWWWRKRAEPVSDVHRELPVKVWLELGHQVCHEIRSQHTVFSGRYGSTRHQTMQDIPWAVWQVVASTGDGHTQTQGTHDASALVNRECHQHFGERNQFLTHTSNVTSSPCPSSVPQQFHKTA